MKVKLALGVLELKVSIECIKKTVSVRGHFRMINGRKVYVRPHFRRK